MTVKKRVRELLQKPRVTLLFLFVKAPFWIGAYDEKGLLIESISIVEGKASDILPSKLDLLLQKYEPTRLIYANGPGNQMSIKISFVCLKTLSIARNIPLEAANSFEFNASGLIELANKRFFCFENDKITLKYIEDGEDSPIELPCSVDGIRFSDTVQPLYVLPPA